MKKTIYLIAMFIIVVMCSNSLKVFAKGTSSYDKVAFNTTEIMQMLNTKKELKKEAKTAEDSKNICIQNSPEKLNKKRFIIVCIVIIILTIILLMFLRNVCEIGD